MLAVRRAAAQRALRRLLAGQILPRELDGPCDTPMDDIFTLPSVVVCVKYIACDRTVLNGGRKELLRTIAIMGMAMK